MRALLLVLALVTTAHASPWSDRCAKRLAPFGKAVFSTHQYEHPTNVEKTERDRFGMLTLTVGKLVARVGSDRTSWQDRSRIYDTWHSPYEDTRRGKPGKPPLDEEYHSHPGALWADLHGEGPRDALESVLLACLNDVTVDEADPDLAWSTSCFRDLAAARERLIRVDDLFARSTCSKEPYGAKCGAEPAWSVEIIAGDRGSPKWISTGDRSESYGPYGASISADRVYTAADYKALREAFEAPLEGCYQRMHAARYP